MINNIVSSKVTLKRNIAGTKFGHLLDKKAGAELVERIGNAIKTKRIDCKIFDVSSLDRAVLDEYLFKGFIDQGLLENQAFSAFALSVDNSKRIYIGAKNHIEIQSVSDNDQLTKLYSEIDIIDDKLASVLDFAFDSEWGYLTSEIDCIGTGLKIEIDMILPALEITRKTEDLGAMLSKLGVNCTNISKKFGCFGMYRLSNMITINKTERDIVELMQAVVSKTIQLENDAMQKLSKNIFSLKDKCYRAYGLLSNAHVLNERELGENLVLLLLGIESNLFDETELNLVEYLYSIKKITKSADAGNERAKITRQMCKNLRKIKE